MEEIAAEVAAFVKGFVDDEFSDVSIALNSELSLKTIFSVES